VQISGPKMKQADTCAAVFATYVAARMAPTPRVLYFYVVEVSPLFYLTKRQFLRQRLDFVLGHFYHKI